MKHYLFVLIIILYLLNFTLGIYEIPENLPIIGHIDEVAASGLLFYSLQEIRRQRRAGKPQ